MPPQSPAPFQQGMGAARQNSHGPYQDNPMVRQSTASFGDMNRMHHSQSPYQDYPSPHRPSMGNLRSVANASPQRDAHMSAYGHASRQSLGYAGGARTPLGQLGNGHQSTSSFDFLRGSPGPDDTTILDAIQATLREVDLDTVTKKQVRALVEQRLQTELVGERRVFMDRQIDNELANM